MIVVVVVVVLLVVSVLAYALLTPPAAAPAVQISYIAAWAPDNVCGLKANPVFFYGYNTSENANDSLELYGWPNYNSTACTIKAVTTNTTGFALRGMTLPLNVPGGDTNISLNLTIEAPGSSYTGPLNLVFA